MCRKRGACPPVFLPADTACSELQSVIHASNAWKHPSVAHLGFRLRPGCDAPTCICMPDHRAQAVSLPVRGFVFRRRSVAGQTRETSIRRLDQAPAAKPGSSPMSTARNRSGMRAGWSCPMRALGARPTVFLVEAGRLAAYLGASRMAPSRRITSPLSMSFSKMCRASLA
jgi:hypothetical protein